MFGGNHKAYSGLESHCFVITIISFNGVPNKAHSLLVRDCLNVRALADNKMGFS